MFFNLHHTFLYCHRYIATELCSGSVRELFNGDYDGPLVGEHKEILRQVTKGVQHLHTYRIIHRDINPSNVLISYPNGTNGPLIKLAGFGISRIVSESSSLLTRTKTNSGYSQEFLPFGTYGWIAPEILNSDQTYTVQVDIFPLGILFAFILNDGIHPYGENKEMRLNDHLKKEPTVLTAVKFKNNHKAFELIQWMLSADPNKRPTAAQVLEHEYFNQSTLRIIQDGKCEEFVLGKLSGCRKCIKKPCRLGTGGSAFVFVGKYSVEETAEIKIDVAIKRVKIVNAEIEVDILKKLQHPNILHYYWTERTTEFM